MRRVGSFEGRVGRDRFRSPRLPGGQLRRPRASPKRRRRLSESNGDAPGSIDARRGTSGSRLARQGPRHGRLARRDRLGARSSLRGLSGIRLRPGRALSIRVRSRGALRGRRSGLGGRRLGPGLGGCRSRSRRRGGRRRCGSGGRDGCGLRSWCGRRRGCRRRVGGTPRREQRERVDVPVVADTHSEVDVGSRVLWLARRPAPGDRIALDDAGALLHEQRAEVRKRGPVPVGGRDRDGEPVRGHGAREGHVSARRGSDGRSSAELDVDPAVLASRVLVVPDRVTAENRPVGGPCPGRCQGRRPESGGEPGCQYTDQASRCP